MTIVILALVEFALVAIDYSHSMEPPAPIRLFSREHSKEIPEAEGMFRFDPYTFWELRPGARVFDQESERISSAGFRGEEMERDRTPGVLRVACLGDSSVFGVSCSLEESFPEALKRELDARLSSEKFRGIEMLNAGVPGYTAVQGLQTLQRKVMSYRPDVIVLMFGAFNECYRRKPPILAEAPKGRRTIHMAPAPLLADLVADASALEGDESGDIVVSAGPNWGRLVARKLTRFRFVQLLASIIPDGSAGAAREELEKYAGDAAANVGSQLPRVSLKSFAECMSAMIDLGVGSDAQVIVLAPPRRPELREAIPILNKFDLALSEVARRWRVPFIDLEPLFDADESLFVPGDPIHPNARGHAVIATKLAEWIVANESRLGTR